jgi:glycosyltransferase involved in cell wall biosynthesis
MNNSNLPLVTVVTPAYNQAIFLRDTIESVLSQDYPNIELLVLNDGSTDNTEEILKEYTGRIKWETQKNMGQTPTINKGWSMTEGEIITWLNSDDTYLPGAVKGAVDYLLAHPETSVVFADSIFTEADGTPLNRTNPWTTFDYKNYVLSGKNNISQPSAFIRRNVLAKAGELEPFYYYCMDWDFWLRVGLHFKIDHVDAIWSTYRLHSESKTVSQLKRAAPELEYMYKKLFSRADLPKEVKAIEKKAMMNMYFTTASLYLGADDRKSAKKMAKMAVKSNMAGIFSVSTIHQFMYFNFSNSGLYKSIRKIFGKRK